MVKERLVIGRDQKVMIGTDFQVRQGSGGAGRFRTTQDDCNCEEE